VNGGRMKGGLEGGRVSRWLRSFAAFWYDFIISDDWRVAALVAGALAATAVAVHVAQVNAWWLMPVGSLAALGWSLRRATRPGKGNGTVRKPRRATTGG
jgi:hypothetical protein